MLTTRGLKLTALILSTLICVGCGVAAYVTYQSGLLKETESDAAFLANVLVIGLPFGASLALSFLCDNKVWPISLGTIIFAYAANFMIVKSHFPVDSFLPPVWREMIALFLPIGMSFICCLIAIFSKEKMDYTTEPPAAYAEPSVSSSTKSPGTGAYGFPEEMGPNYHPTDKY